jgi:mannosyltransferase OCH1-like enzyme
LEKYGGIWLDSDTLVMNSLDTLFSMMEKGKDGFFFLENGKNVMNGVFGSRPGTPLMSEWKKRMLDILYGKETMFWNSLGSELLDSMHNSLFSNYSMMNGLNTVSPVDWRKCVSEYLEKPYENYKNLERDFQPLIVLVNSVYKHIESNGKRPNCALDYFMEKSRRNLDLGI